jgi:hypothetical protein
MFGIILLGIPSIQCHVQNEHKGPLQIGAKKCSIHKISYIISIITNVLNPNIRPPLLVFVGHQ